MAKPAVVSKSTIGRVKWAFSGDPLFHRVEASLPAAHRLVGSQSVLDEMQGPPGFEDTLHLAQGGADVGDGAHRPGGECCVIAIVLKGQPLAVQAGSAHRDTRRLEALGRQVPADAGGLDPVNSGDCRRIEGNV